MGPYKIKGAEFRTLNSPSNTETWSLWDTYRLIPYPGLRVSTKTENLTIKLGILNLKKGEGMRPQLSTRSRPRSLGSKL